MSTSRVNAILEQNHTESTLGLFALIQIGAITVVLSLLLNNLHITPETNAFICLAVAFICFFMCFHSANATPINVLKKSTNTIVFTVRSGFIILPFISSYKIDKTKDFQIKLISGNTTFSPWGNHYQIEVSAYGDFMVVNAEQYQLNRGYDKITSQLIGQIKGRIKKYVNSNGNIDNEVMEEICKEVKSEISDNFGVIFHEYASITAYRIN